jgi:hypothetical protein
VNDSPAVAVVFDAPAITPPAKARWYHYVAAWCWNLYRKPLVIRKQRQLNEIYRRVKADMAETLLPVLWDKRHDCTDCFNAYMALKPQIFLSQIEMILRRMQCQNHAVVYRAFLVAHMSEFHESERLASWINGFVK